VALYAIDHTSAASLAKASAALRSEKRSHGWGGNGVGFVLALHKRLEQEVQGAALPATMRRFMQHGYTPEIYTPYVDVKTVNAAEGAALEELGYKKEGKVRLDPADPSTEAKYMYVLKDAA